ncbi:SLC13 family permease [Salinicola halophilus]|uniref:SLC13 family permease n=1 Tax=Salinicola halophilus TaxID=184065 RepID=UPI000DA13FEA|nr:SLC13 family permease [Salinicola halophilus]
MMSLVVIGAIVVSIVLGYRTRINIGLFAIAFAYLIGCFGLDLGPSEVIAMWPLKIFFIIFSVCLFYSFAIVNGTLEKLAEHLMYRCRRVPSLMPFAIFLAATVISALGAGYYTVLAFMAPITLLLCNRSGLNLIVGAMAVNYGALAGANFVSSQSGIIFRTLMTSSGIPEDTAFINSFGIFASTLIVPIIVLAGLVLVNRRRGTAMASLDHIERPSPLDPNQKKTLTLTLIMMAMVLLPPIASLLLPDNAAVGFINSKVNIALIASVFSVIALLMKLGDERKAIASLPWGTIIMICGVGMLISVAIAAGTLDLLGAWIGTNIPPVLVPVAFGVAAALMSLFASTLGVVTPALFPLVPPMAATLGIDPMIVFIAIVVGAQATSISPFSSGGSLILGSCPDDQARAGLLPKLLFRAAPLGFVAAMIFNLLLAFVF